MDHSYRRGLLLALAGTMVITLMGRIDMLAAYGQIQRLWREIPRADFFVTMAVMIIPGAFLAGLPERIRRRGEKRRSSLKGCIVCVVGGLAGMIGAGLAGGGDGLMLTGIFQGSVSAYVFLIVSAVAGLAAGRIAEGRKRT